MEVFIDTEWRGRLSHGLMADNTDALTHASQSFHLDATAKSKLIE